VVANNVIRNISSFQIEENLESCIYTANVFTSNTQNIVDFWFTLDFICAKELKCCQIKMETIRHNIKQQSLPFTLKFVYLKMMKNTIQVPGNKV